MTAAVMMAAFTPARAQSIHGLAEVQYQTLERTGFRRETWTKTFQTDYARRLPGAVELAARLRFTEQTVAGQRDRLRLPEGSLRLAHRNAGIAAILRPTEARDARGLTLRQQNLSISGYAQKPGLPVLNGSWVRSHVDSSEQVRESATITRSVSSSYTRSGMSLHAGYGDRAIELEPVPRSRLVERHVNAGSLTQFQIGAAPVTLQYDFIQAWADPTGVRPLRSRAHTAGATGSMPISAKTAASLAYTYRRSGTVGQPATLAQDHNGTLAVSYSLAPATVLTTGAGVRSALFGGRTLTERFINAGVAAQAEARPGWRMGAATGRTYAWLPGSPSRATDNLGANTSMRLAEGLDARADVALGVTRNLETAGDSLAPRRETGLTFGAGLAATPLRSVFLDASARRSRTGVSGPFGGPITTAYAATARITPAPRLQLGGGWTLTRGFATRGATVRATVLWSPGASLQATGSYDRSRQRTLAPFLPLAGFQESYTGTVAVALGRAMNAAFRYSETNPGQPSHLRQVSVNLSRRFGR
jgi:hypothetical protein